MARLDASWTRVDAWKDPEPVAGAKWELVEESDELVILDIGEAEHAAKTEVNIAPGTDVSLTVGRIAHAGPRDGNADAQGRRYCDEGGVGRAFWQRNRAARG